MADTIKEIRIGLIGFGSMGRTHTWAIRNIPFFYRDLPFRAVPYGICTAHPEKAKASADELGIPHVFATAEELISSPDVDVVDICTPNNLHYDAVLKAVRAGKHVLCEKPLGVTPEEANEMANLPVKKGQVTGMVFNNRWLSAPRRAKELMEEGRLGKILSFRGYYLHSSATDVNKPAGWKQNRDVCGGGVLFDLGSHVIDMLTWLIGPFTEISGLSQIAYPVRRGMNGEEWQTNADESFSMLAKTKDGAMGTMTVGKVQTGTNDDFGFEIYGSEGAMRFSLMEPNVLHFYDTKRADGFYGGDRGFTPIECVGRYPGRIFPSPKAPDGWLSGHLESMKAFLTAVATGAEFHPSFRDGARIQATMDAAYESDRNHSVLTEVKSCW